MKQVLTFMAIVSLLALCAAEGTAQERVDSDPSGISREEWQARVTASRQKAEVMKHEHRGLIFEPPTPGEIAAEASRRVLEDETLVPGDIVSTNRGLFRFQGSPESERKPDDFIRMR